MARCLAFLLAFALAGATVAKADNGEGFFSISLSNDTEFLNVTAVDPDTLLELPGTFTANGSGEYFLEGLVILDGDTANPFGEFEVTGQGDPELQTKFRWIVEEGFKPPGIVLFASFISGIQIEEPPNDFYEKLQTIQSVTATGSLGTPPVDASSNANVFVETDDGFSANAIDAGVGGAFAIPGITNFDSGVVNLPDLPNGTTEDHFGVLVIQNDIGLFDVATDTNFTLTSTVHTHILAPPSGIPGDYNNDGRVDAADYVMWRNNPGMFGGAQGYTEWVNNFGATQPGAGNDAAVPEPGMITLLFTCSLVLLILGFQRGRDKSLDCE